MAKSMWVSYGAIPIASRLVSIAAAILVTPLLTETLGNVSFGLWETLVGVTLIASVWQLAINNTASFFTAKTTKENRSQRVSRIVGLCWTLTLFGMTVFVPITYYSSNLLMDGLGIPERFSSFIQSSLPVIVSVSFLQVQSQCFLGVLNGLGYSGQAAAIFGFSQAFLYVVAGILVVLGCGLYALPIAMAVSCLITVLTSAFALHAKKFNVCFFPVLPTKHELRTAAGYAGFVMASNSIGVGRTVLDRIIIARADLALAGNFGLSQRLVSLLIASFGVVSGPLTAKITRTKVQLGDNAVAQIYKKISVAIAISAGVIGCSLLLFRTPLFVIWLGKDHIAAHQFLLIGVFGAVSAITFAGPAVIITKGIGRPDIETRYALVSCILLLLIKPFGLYFGGILGGVAATSVSWGIAAIYMQRRANVFVQNSCNVNNFQYGIYSLVALCGILSWQLGGINFWPNDRLSAVYLMTTLMLGLMMIFAVIIALKKYHSLRHIENSNHEKVVLKTVKEAA